MKDNKLLFAKVNPEAKIPSKENENAGYDIYPCFEEESLVIPAHQTVLVPTGIASAFSSDYYVQIEERGSTGSKGIKKSAGVIDSGYRGEWFIAITNCNDRPIVIAKSGYKPKGDIIVYPYEKAIAQAVVHKVPVMDIKEISYDELKKISSNRGIGALGSSGK